MVWNMTEDGMFNMEELEEAMPKTLLTGYVNPTPLEKPKEK